MIKRYGSILQLCLTLSLWASANNARCFEYLVIIRAINTIDAMSATIERVDWDVLQGIDTGFWLRWRM